MCIAINGVFCEMRYIKLTKSERVTLEWCFKNHPKSHVRIRCQSLLLSDEGWRVKQIAMIHHTRSRTIYTWFDRWDDLGIVGLMILQGRGIKPKLKITDASLVEAIKKKP